MTEQMHSLTVSAQTELRALQAELQDLRDRVEQGARHDAVECSDGKAGTGLVATGKAVADVVLI